MSVTGRVREVIEASLATQGLEVLDVEHSAAVLRVTVDRPGGVDLDAVSTASRLVSDDLDRHDVVPGRYVLEVSSPGIERPLRTPEHFARFVGTRVAVRTTPGTEGDRRVEGVLGAVDADGFTVAGRRLSFTDVERARTVFEWGPAPKPGGKRGARPKATAGAATARSEVGAS
ncbi:MAG: ribosome maturation factor RimP [Acidimicrobiales bacterium]